MRLLEARRSDVQSKRDRHVTAIAKGSGSAPEVLFREVEVRETALNRLAAEIAEAEEQVAPLLSRASDAGMRG